jgi:hypothetical protein
MGKTLVGATRPRLGYDGLMRSARCVRYARRLFIRRLVVLGWLCLSAGGCSLLVVEGPPSGHETMHSYSCTESGLIPNFDVAGAVILFGVSAVVAPEDKTSGSVRSTSGSASQAAAALGGAVLLGASAWIGKRRVGRCRAARLDLARRGDSLRAAAAPTTEIDRLLWPMPHALAHEQGTVGAWLGR